MRYISSRWARFSRRWKTRRTRKRGSKKFFIAVALFFLFIFLLFSEVRLSSLSPLLTKEAARRYLAESINHAIEDVMQEDQVSDDFVVVQKGENEKISSIQANAYALNSLKTKLTSALLHKFNGRAKVRMPVGSLTNISLLNGRGFSLPVKLNVEGSAEVSFHSEMQTAGVNQSCHRITLTIYASIVSHSRKHSAEAEYRTELVVSEMVIVGEVPHWIKPVK